MDLRKYDDRPVSIETTDGLMFEGRAYFQSAEYCFHEYGTEKDALEIDGYIFYEDQMDSVSICEKKDGYLWGSRPMHFMKLQRGPYEMMEKGLKTIELRLNDAKRQKLKTGDVIRFEMTDDESETLHMTVIDIHRFTCFRELYEKLPLLSMGYTEEEVSQASYEDMYAYYSREDEERYGVLGIEVKEYC